MILIISIAKKQGTNRFCKQEKEKNEQINISNLHSNFGDD